MDALNPKDLPKDVEDPNLYVQNQLTLWHNEYVKKHPISIQIKYPSAESIQKLCQLYGSIAFCMENEKLTAYILDR